MNYTIYNYKGDVINESLSQEDLDVIINGDEFNCFEWDVDIHENFLSQQHENIELALSDIRVYKKIQE